MVEVEVGTLVEGHLDGLHVDRQTCKSASKARGVLFSSYDDVVCAGKGVECFLDAGNVADREIVVVREREMLYASILFEFGDERVGVGYARNDKDIVHAPQVHRGLMPIQCAQGKVPEIGEKDLLVVLQAEVLHEIVPLNGVEVGRRLGNDDNAGAVAGTLEFAQVTVRENVVAAVGVAVLGKQDVDAGLDVAMLENIVEDDKLGSG